MDSAEIYDPTLGTWSQTAPMTSLRVNHTATLLADGRVLVSGGFNHDVFPYYLDSAEIYDPSSGNWSLTGAMTTPRLWHTATLLSDGRVLISGGLHPNVFPYYLASAEISRSGPGDLVVDGAHEPRPHYQYHHAAV